MSLSKEAREARKAYYKKWREQNKDKVRSYRKKWREQNPEKIKEYQERYWAKEADRAMDKLRAALGGGSNGC